MLDKAKLIAVGSRRIEAVEIASLEDKVNIRAMTGAETDGYSESITVVGKDAKGGATREFVFSGSRAKLVALCICDEAGQPLLTIDEANALANRTLNELFEACQKVNGVKEDQKAEAKND